METDIDKNKVMVIGYGKSDIYMNGVSLKDIQIRIVTVKSAMAKLYRVWQSHSIRITSK